MEQEDDYYGGMFTYAERLAERKKYEENMAA